MGNMQCPAEDAAALASVARDICPFPNYNTNPHITNMLSINSSRHLRDHYMAVQSSLTPKQLEDFNKGLRSTFGREGKVTLGGVGVVALSLAVLFDTLAKRVKGEWVSDSGPIPGLFLKDLRGFYPLHAHTVSEYLRLVPHIANNPTRMREETERYMKQLMTDETHVDERMRQRNDDITGVNFLLRNLFQMSLRIHLTRITNSTFVSQTISLFHALKKNPVPVANSTEAGGAHIVKTRKKRIPAPENSILFNLNCDPESASKDFLDVTHKSKTQEAFRRCRPFHGRLPKTLLHYIARLVWLDVINNPLADFQHNSPFLIPQREDFDLKTDALQKWAK